MVYNAIKSASPDDKLVQLKALEILNEVAKGDANKIFIPFEATSALRNFRCTYRCIKRQKKRKRKE